MPVRCLCLCLSGRRRPARWAQAAAAEFSYARKLDIRHPALDHAREIEDRSDPSG